ncbi:GL24863 [Drosophila persimilis]|uniref:GL24863 n=1 Tax=Drosophila persimilis TaxID=7234 RepID=B4GRV1_DROPE|nr:GL24863 [Drosophila persimilis]
MEMEELKASSSVYKRELAPKLRQFSSQIVVMMLLGNIRLESSLDYSTFALKDPSMLQSPMVRGRDSAKKDEQRRNQLLPGLTMTWTYEALNDAIMSR